MNIMYIMQTVSVAETRQHLAEILGKVAFGGESFIISKKGRPMARIVPIEMPKPATEKPRSLADVKGWLDDDDPFFANLERIREESRQEVPVNPFAPKKRAKKSSK